MKYSPHDARPGTVYLIGAGPGDPGLLTLRGAHLLGMADVVVYDNLVAIEILEMAPPQAERIYAGKQRGDHSVPQDELNLLLVRLARQNRCVIRLKGGDPYIFGRGGEEAQTLVAHGIPFEVVPGITAASGVAAYAGIPLTHRDHAHAVTFVTGHLQDGTMDLDWPALARSGQTVVIYMGLTGINVLCEKLIEHGLPAHWPAAIVQQGTRSSQRTVTGTLATLPERARAAGLKAPTLIIVGRVAGLQPDLAWFPESA
ncbi:MAG: uroporphyrinogen-III C-methyltransferase [Proteobacteria bacterium]|nr:uroporphyrinogen-III C-methyltransferase [Pseudomonadota bacterium]HQR04618.1 uroporphyrinogen-III C-methyltransferase [Rhodocyclaceae bacterium]